MYTGRPQFGATRTVARTHSTKLTHASSNRLSQETELTALRAAFSEAGEQADDFA
jgi:hypothetical protein